MSQSSMYRSPSTVRRRLVGFAVTMVVAGLLPNAAQAASVSVGEPAQPAVQFLPPGALPAPTRSLHIKPSGAPLDTRFTAPAVAQPACTKVGSSTPVPPHRRVPSSGTTCAAPATHRSPGADILYGTKSARPATVAPMVPTAAARGGEGQSGVALVSSRAGSYASPDWVQQSTGLLSGRYGSATAYDSVHQQVVLFGGISAQGTYLNDTWIWNGQVWTQANLSGAAPAPRGYAQMAFDAARGKVVLFGGYAGPHAASPDDSDTWTWDGATWTQQAPATSPPGRDSGAVDYLPQTSSLVLFGGTYTDGAGQHDLNDTWSWNGTTWQQLGPFASKPSPRYGHQLSYDGATGQLVLFGGIESNTVGADGDTWTYTSGAWTMVAASSSPSPRFDASMVYDAALNGVLLFGGYATDNGGGDQNDTWLWNGADWLLATGIASPIGRDSAAMGYDAVNNQMVITGGYDGGTLGDTWTYTEGSTGVPVAPTLTDSLDRTNGVYGRGETATFQLTLGNPSTVVMTGASLSDALSSGMQAAPVPITVTDVGTGGPISCTGAVSCTVTPSGFSITGLTVPSNDSIAVAYPVLMLGSERGCSRSADSAEASAPAGSSSASASPVTCDSGLGTQPWWQYSSTDVGGGETASVDMADGNMVLTADDATVPAHGALSFDLHRAYNSEDSGVAVPGRLAIGWLLTVDQSDAMAKTGVTVNSLYVNPQETATQLFPIVLVDRDGSRFLFTDRPLGQPVDVTSLAPNSSNVLASLAPRVLQLDAGYDHVCVDQSYTAPAGAHLSMWRYVEVKASSPSTPCTAAAGTTPAVLGFAAERPDRIRYEFAWDGHKLDVEDGSANEFRYRYVGPPSSGVSLGNLLSVSEPASGRAVTFRYTRGETDVADPAGRVVRYRMGSYIAPHLVQVAYGYRWDTTQTPPVTLVNPAASGVSYTYGSCTGSSVDQLCGVLDPRNGQTHVTYSSTPSGGSTPFAGPPHLATLTDRDGYDTTLSYYASPDWATADKGSSRLAVRAFDAAGRAGEVDGGDRSNNYLHVTVQRWDVADPSLAPCRQPDAVPDNNLCRVFRYTLDGKATAEDTSYVYNAEGQLLRTRRCLAASDPGPGQSLPNCASGYRTTTAGYAAQYLESGGTVSTFRDAVSGGSTVRSDAGGGPGGARADSATLFYLSDHTQSLTARGNAAGSSYQSYLTTYKVDAVSSVPANQRIGGPICAAPTPIATNTGSLCETDAPAYDSSGAPTVTKTTYGIDGEPTQVVHPLAIEDQQTGQPPTPTVYTYYPDSATDLSGTTSAGGWLEAQQDPLGDTTVFAYDAAGHPVRAWQPDATQGIPLTAFPGTIAQPASTAYQETLYAAESGTLSYSNPWRFVASTRDALGDLTTYSLDANGNRLTIRSPRGNQAGTSVYDTTQTFDAMDRIASTLAPVEAAGPNPQQHMTSYSYDALGNVTVVVDPTGAKVHKVYDAVNRLSTTEVPRGPSSLYAKPTACRVAGSGDPNYASGEIVCSTSQTYDGVDNVLTSVDADAQSTTYVYDGVHDKTSTLAPSDDGTSTSLRTDAVYDPDGNVTDQCPPREFTEGGSSTCTSGGAYSTHYTYDLLDRTSTTTTYASAGGAAQVVRQAHDADGNVVAVTDARGATTATSYDLADRKVSTTTPRSHGSNGPVTFTTSLTYDPSGNLTSTSTPVSASSPTPATVTAYSYDAANRLIDTVVGADDTNARLAGTHGGSYHGQANIRTRKEYDADGNVIAVIPPNAFTGTTATDTGPNPYWAWVPDPAYQRATDYDADGRKSTDFVPRFDAADGDPGIDGTQTAQCPKGAAPQEAPPYPSDAAVCVTRYSYDGAGQLTQERLPTSNGSDERYLAYAYTDDHLRAAEMAPDPSVSSGGAQITTASYLYDGSGRQLRVTDAMGNSTVRTYYADGLLDAVTGTPGPSASHQTVYHYDANGNQVISVDSLGNLTRTVYTTDNRRASITDPDGNVTTYGYDANGNVTTVASPSANAKDSTNPGGVAAVNVYTDDNLLAQSASPISSSQYRVNSYTYDGSGRKLTQDVGSGPWNPGPNGSNLLQHGGTQTYGYYPDGRLSVENGYANDSIVYRYDDDGNVSGVDNNIPVAANPQVRVSMTYYLDDRPRTTTENSAQLANAVTATSYDALGSQTGHQTRIGIGPSVVSTTTQYTDAEQPASLTSPVAGSDGQTNATILYGYDQDGHLRSTASRNQPFNETYAYNADNTLQSIQANSPATVSSWQYAYDGDYRLASSSHGYQDVNGTWKTATAQYTYSNGGRLLRYLDGQSAWTATWDHDGNRLTWTNGVTGTTNTYNPDDSIKTSQMTSLPTVTYQYTAFGDVAADGCMAYGYDGFDRLTSTAPQMGTTTCQHVAQTTYYYDGYNRQVQQIMAGSGTAAQTTKSTYYAGTSPLATDVLTTVGQQSSTRTSYLVDAAGRRLGDTLYNTAGSTTAASSERLMDNGMGTITGVYSSTSSNVACTATFDPFGVPVMPVSPSSPCQSGSANDTFFYQGGQVDSSTGNYQMGSRTYDPTKGSFMQADAYNASTVDDLGLSLDPGTANRYGYVDGDPVNFSDPTGHDVCRENPQDCVNAEGTEDLGIADAQTAGSRGGNAQQVARAHASGVRRQPAADAAHQAVRRAYAAAAPLRRLQEGNSSDGPPDYSLIRACTVHDSGFLGWTQSLKDSCSPSFVIEGDATHADWASLCQATGFAQHCEHSSVALGPLANVPTSPTAWVSAGGGGDFGPSVYVVANGAPATPVTLTGKDLEVVIAGTQGGQSNVGFARPTVTDPKLQNFVNDLYKGEGSPNQIGTGSTADALRREYATGQPTEGKFHEIKADQYSRGLANWLRNNPNASAEDTWAAQGMLQDLLAALSGE